MKQRVTLVALIVVMGVIAVVQILRSNSVAQGHPRFRVERLANERLRSNELHTVTLTPIPAHTPQTDGP
jgi:hypothetical protein